MSAISRASTTVIVRSPTTSHTMAGPVTCWMLVEPAEGTILVAAERRVDRYSAARDSRM